MWVAQPKDGFAMFMYNVIELELQENKCVLLDQCAVYMIMHVMWAS